MMIRKMPVMLFTLILSQGFAQQQVMTQEMKTEGTIATQVVADRDDKNNNFYDNEETYSLPMQEIVVEGEIGNPGKVDFSRLTRRSVIVKEALLKQDSGNRFVGAYRYDGYSLFDILNDRILQKKNAAEFKPIIDLYVEIENNKGEKVVLSWGEIYYPGSLHNIIIADRVMRIVPSKTKDLWPLPVESKLVVSQDLISERNIAGPAKIRVISYPGKFRITRDMSPLISRQTEVSVNGELRQTITGPLTNYQTETQHTIFYGKGRGIHSTQPFHGIYLKELLKDQVSLNQKNLRSGLVLCAGIDGYRSVYSLSEIMNRNDQAEVMLVPCPAETDGGMFRIFPACDFFSDRAVKALSEIRVETGR